MGGGVVGSGWLASLGVFSFLIHSCNIVNLSSIVATSPQSTPFVSSIGIFVIRYLLSTGAPYSLYSLPVCVNKEEYLTIDKPQGTDRPLWVSVDPLPKVSKGT